MKLAKLSIIAGLMLVSAHTSFAEGMNTPFPEGYRNWLHVKSMLIKPGHPLENPFQGIHHIYANSKAVEGLKTGNYADDAVLVFDLLEYSETDSDITEGERKLIGVMHKNASRYAETGGWGFEAFSGNSRSERIVQDGGKSCFDCHTSERDSGYVFAKIRN